MENQFTTYGTAEVMVANISYAEAEKLNDTLAEIKGVQSVAFDRTTDHYNHASALYTVTFDYDENNDECLAALDAVKEALADYDLFVSTELGNTLQETIDAEVNVIMVYVAVIVVVVLLLTSQTYGEVPVLLLTFVTAMILNQGSNFLLGKISFVSNSVTSILQLALSLDYAVILCNHFKEQHETLPIREAAITALAHSIPEISASSLTTVGGLMAMLFMQFKIGADMGICLIKAIIYALLSVFILMPGLLVLFGPLIEKTRHRDFIPKISFVGKIDYATRHVVPVVFVIVALLGMHFSSKCPYAYGYSSLTTPKLNESQIADNMVADNFTSSNMLALIVPAGDYEKEAQLLNELGSYDEVDYTMGLANVEAMDGYMLADKLTPRQFAELSGLDYEVAQLVYAAYAAENDDYGKLVGSIATYKAPLIDMFLFVCDQVDASYVTLDAELHTVVPVEVRNDGSSRITRAILENVPLYYSNDMLILENGKAYGIGSMFPDYSSLLGNIAELYRSTEYTSAGDSCTVSISGAQAAELLKLLCPALSGNVESIADAYAETVIENGAVSSITVSASGSMDGAAFEISAVIDGITHSANFDIPEKVSLAAAKDNASELPEISSDLFRIVSAWAELDGRESIVSSLRLSADCGPVVLNTSLDVSSREYDGKRIYCVGKNDLKLYTDGIAQLVAIISPDASELDADFAYGTVSITIDDGSITGLSVRCTGTMQVVLVETAVSVSADVEIQNGSATQFPEKAVSALTQKIG